MKYSEVLFLEPTDDNWPVPEACFTKLFSFTIQIWWKLYSNIFQFFHHQITTNFCTCNHSIAVVAYAKFCSDYLFMIWMTANNIKRKLWIVIVKSWVKWSSVQHTTVPIKQVAMDSSQTLPSNHRLNIPIFTSRPLLSFSFAFEDRSWQLHCVQQVKYLPWPDK